MNCDIILLKGGENMRVSFKYYVKLDKLHQEIIEELSYHTTKLYNIA